MEARKNGFSGHFESTNHGISLGPRRLPPITFFLGFLLRPRSVPFGVAFIVLLAVFSPLARSESIQAVYLVSLEQGVSPPEFAAARGMSVVYEYHHAFNGLAVLADSYQAFALSNEPRILAVQRDGPVHIAAQTLPTGIDRIEADRNGLSKIDGTDERVPVTVAIIDTGIQLDHPDLNVNQTFMKNCIGAGQPLDGNGHGTHVSGTVGALDNGIGVVGVAPGANLIAVKVLDDAGFGSFATIACGLDWVAANSALIDVVSMSLGGDGSDDGNCGLTNGDLLHTAICGLVAKGVVVVVAAGNSATDAKYIVPAAYDEVITVSAVADSDGKPGHVGPETCRTKPDDVFASFSNYGPDVDIAAPGECILSTYKGSSYKALSGTSMATPHVSAMAAEYILARGKPIDQSGTVDVKNGLIFLGFAQSGSYGFTGDPDLFHEPMLNGWNYTFSGPVPPPPLEGDFTFSPSDPKTGESVTFSPLAVGGTPPYSYSWAFGDGGTGTGDPGTNTYTQTGVFNAVLTLSDSASQTTSVAKSVGVTAPTQLIADFTDSPEHKTPGLVSFFAVVSGGVRPYSYSWTWGDGTPVYNTTSSAISHSFSEGTYTVTMTVADSNSPSSSATSSHSIVVVSSGSIEVHLAITTTAYIRGHRVNDNLMMTSAVARGSPPYTFLWDFGDGVTSTQSSSFHVYGVAGTYLVRLTATDSGGASETVSRSTTVDSPATSQPLGMDWTFSSMDPGATEVVAFSAAVSGGQTPYNLTWAFGDGSPKVYGTLTATHAYAVAGYYFPSFQVIDGGATSIWTGRTLIVSGSSPPPPPPPPNSKVNTTTRIEVHDPSDANVTASSVPLGVALHDSATVSAQGVGPPMTGYVTYRRFATSDCGGTVTDEVVVTVGQESPPATLGAGTYGVQANYSGDSNYNTSVSFCQPFSVQRNATTVGVSLYDSSHTPVTSVPLGTAVHGVAAAVRAVNAFPITGSLRYDFFPAADCTGAPVSETVAVGNESTPRTLGPGPYGYMATYGGDGNYLASASACESFTVTKGATSMTIRIHSSSHSVVESISPGARVHADATVAGRVGTFVMTGFVEFRFFTTGNCTGSFVSQTVSVGSESGNSDPLETGTYSFSAVYFGDQNYASSAGSCSPLRVTESLQLPLPPTSLLLMLATIVLFFVVVALSVKNRRLRRIATRRTFR